MAKSLRQPTLPGIDDLADDEVAAAVEPESVAVAEARCQAPATAPPDLTGKTVYVVDANSLIFQVFHAIPEMTGPKGEPVNAVFGFTRDLLHLIEHRNPDYLFCAFDMAGPTFRHNRYEQYKATRSEMPNDLAPQFPAIHRVASAMGIPVLGVEEYEADDLLATLAHETEQFGGDCFLVTADKDCRQLITEHVSVYNVRKDAVFDAAALKQEWGIAPEQVVDFQSLVGDAVDNIPGVARIGPKTARELLEKYGTLEGIYEHIDEITGAKRQYLLDGRQNAFLSRELVRLDSAVPGTIDWQAGRVGGFDVPKLLALCAEFGFHRMTDQIRSLDVGHAPAEWIADYRTVDTPEKFAAFLDDLRRQPHFSFDTETTSINPTQAEIVGYSFAWKAGEAYYLPVRGPASEAKLDAASTLAALRPVLEDEHIGKIGQNLKYDVLVLRAAGVTMRGVQFDTMVASYLLDAGERNHNLDELAARYLNHTNIKISELIGTGKNQKCIDEAPIERVTQYAGEDADVALRLWPMLAAKLEEAGLTELFERLEMPLVDVLVELEYNGIQIDVERLAALSSDYGGRITGLEQEIYTLAGREFNIASPKQLQQILFVEQKLPVLSKTKTGPSTDVDVLEELARQHPLPAKIIEYRQFAKLKGTYLDALPTMVNPRTRRVHASFHQAVAATGRLSSSDPNLQNIPIRTDTGREIRSAFLPGEKDWLLLAADYSQIELRVLAHFSHDAVLSEAFARDEDIHTLVASQVYNVALDAVTREMRRAAKAVNFGIIYGQSAFGLARALEIEQTRAAEFIDAYFTRYPGVGEFFTGLLEDARQRGYVTTILGRRRAIRGIRPGAPRQRNLSERTAINTVIQGSAADLIKQAMIAVHARLRREQLRARLLLQIHDELIFEVPPDEADALAALVAAEMSGVMTLGVPLKVDVKTGRNWAEV
ncbi:MAG TPA: DNA polymerase I [Pirellulales bacterium]|jgi:DNA polymerase-1|nr:DNA polymerase I [Pirellulales bacterium]